MTIWADESPHRVDPSHTVTTWIVSRHLLVAQAVAAALSSVGMQVLAVPWDAVGWDLDIPDAPAALSTDMVVVLDDLVDHAAIDDIKTLAGAASARVLVATAHSPDLHWGGLVEGVALVEVGLATSVRQLADLITQFEAGESLMDPHVRAALTREWAEEIEERQRLAALMETLSPKERAVLELLALGRRAPEIARFLGVSESTIRTHVKALRKKLGAETQLAAVAMLRNVQNGGLQTRLVPRPRRG